MKIEGKNPVREIVAAGETIEKIMIADGSQDPELRQIQKLARQNGVKVEFVPKEKLDKLSETKHHQGVIAFQNDFAYADLQETINAARENGEDILLVVLDEVLDPHNLGSVIRVAECAGATGVVIPNWRSATVNETVVRTSAGATAHLPVIKVSNLNQAIESMKEQNIWVYGADMDGKTMYDVNLKGDVAIVVGGEGTGIKKLTKSLCDEIVSIPMKGKVNSLNASVSAGIVIYEVIRQRMGK